MLKDGGITCGYHARNGAQRRGPWAMQRADLATFLLDAATQDQYKNAVLGITSA